MRMHRRDGRVVWACLAVSPFLVGFSADDSTGWHWGGGVSQTRAQYATGCSPKYYNQKQTELAIHLDYVKARQAENRWSPAQRVAFDLETVQMTRTQLAETNEEGNPVEFSEWSRPSSTRNRALLRIRGGLAWKYLDVTLGGMLAPQGGLGGLVLPRGLGDGAGERRGVENFLLPAFGLKIGPFKHLYASADFLNGEATVLSEGLLSAGLGFQNQATDVRLSLALGVVSGTKAVLHLEQQWKAVTFLATASVLLDVDAQQVGPLRPGDWADLGLALRVPLAMPH